MSQPAAKDLCRLTAAEASALMRAGDITSEALARACLDRIAARDGDVRAWSYVDPDTVLRQARELDKIPARSPLHGIPVGFKDIFDTEDMPTQHNSPIFAGHRPNKDAAMVRTLRASGALIFGKTDTSEFASQGRLAATRNPYDLSRTAGGSSSGSAAAVGDFHVPLALGTQTGGSLIRPGSFCGAFALKPTWNSVSGEGVKLVSATLDTPGWYGRSVDDLVLMADVFGLNDDAPSGFTALKNARIALCPTPFTADALPEGLEALEAAGEKLRAAGAAVTTLDLPDGFAELGDPLWAIVSRSEGQVAMLDLSKSHPHLLHAGFMANVRNEKGLTHRQLLDAYNAAYAARIAFDTLAAGYDAVLTLSAPGEAPQERTNGNNAFNRLWTLLQVPCINLPAAYGPNGMPVGLTLTGPRFFDRHLLQVAAAVAPLLDPGKAP